MKVFTKESLIEQLIAIKNRGWIRNARQGNHGGVGNTLEDLLGIQENNLPIPNAAEWELKCQRSNSNSLQTLFHVEPSPQALKFVPAIFLPLYGWQHKEAGKKYPPMEMSFRQTICTTMYSDRGFSVRVDQENKKVLVTFNFKEVGARHSGWLAGVMKKAGLHELNPQPYWGFNDLYHIAGSKLKNCFYVEAETKRINGKEHFKYTDIMMLSDFTLDKLIGCIEKGLILVDFDARTGHNHGTKFRFRNKRLPELYQNITKI